MAEQALTMEQLRKMSRDEIAARLDEVHVLLEKQDKQKKQGDDTQ